MPKQPTAADKKKMLEQELSGQPEMAADSDTGGGAGVSTSVKPTGSFESQLGNSEDDQVPAERTAEDNAALDKEIAAAQKRLQRLKTRRAVGPGNRKLKPGQSIHHGDDGRMYIRETIKHPSSGNEMVKDTCIEYEPN